MSKYSPSRITDEKKPTEANESPPETFTEAYKAEREVPCVTTHLPTRKTKELLSRRHYCQHKIDRAMNMTADTDI